MDTMVLGRKIRDLRKNQGLTQESLAAKSGVDRRVIQRIEGGDGSPTLSTLTALSGTLNIGLAELMAFAGQAQPLPDFKSCGELLLALSQADTDFQRFVLTVIHKDVFHMRGSPKLEPLIPQVLALLKLL